MLSKDFWLYRWLDSYLVRSPEQAMRLLREPGARAALMEEAAEAATTRPDVDKDIGFPLVAGSGLDLSGKLNCQNFPCLKEQVDEIFRSAWHYFDRIVIAGPSPMRMLSLWGAADEDYVLHLTESHIRLLLYFRNIGAEDLLLFAEKGRLFCEDCGNLLLLEIGLESHDAYNAYLQELTQKLVKESHFAPSTEGRFPGFTIYHPDYFDEPMDAIMDRAAASPRAVKKRKRSLIGQLVQSHVQQLLADIALARQWQSPLGSTIKFHQQILRRNTAGTEEAQVAINIQLPVLRNADPELLIRIRQDEAEHFIAFRDALRRAIREKLQATSDKDPARIADEIESDLIEPQLNNIKRRLRAAQRLLVNTSAANVALGALATTCGLLTGNDLLVTTGVGGAIAAQFPTTKKYLEDRQGIALSDMYFAWQALRHAAEDA